MSRMKIDKRYSDTNKWACQLCTYLNPISAYPTCKLCEQTDPPIAKYNLANTTSNIVNTSESPTTSMSLAVRDRRYNDETNAEKLFRDIVSYCRKAKIHFVDDQFLPSPRSIGDSDQSLQWLRISDIVPSSGRDQHLNWTVYSSPEPSDIQQGTLGDCWLMAALALIAERPKMLEHIVLTKIVNKEGVYLIRICHNGLWKTVIVDDCFPCTEYNQLAYSQANRHQLYVPLIEKACAKLFGSYAELSGGQTEEGLQLLTGAPCDYIDLDPNIDIFDSDIIWAKLLSACESNLLINAATGRADVSEEKYKRAHIHSNHAFSILAAHSLSQISMQFVLVRDPHAQTDYKEEVITSAVLTRLNSILPFRLPSGAFWISWPVFLEFFASITISSYASDYYDVREVAQFTRSSIEPIPTFHFYVSKTSSVNISLIYHRKNRESFPYHTQSFILCNIKDRKLNDVDTHVGILQTERGAFTHWTGSLSSGYYIIIPFSTSFWDDKNNESIRDYTLVIHSKLRIDVQVINEPATVLSDCLIEIILKENPKESKGKDFNYYTTSRRSNFAMFIAENLSSSYYVNIDVDMTDGICIRNSRRSFITHDCIPPRHRQIVFLAEWTQKANETAKMNYAFQHSHVKQPNDSVPAINISHHDFHSFRPFLIKNK